MWSVVQEDYDIIECLGKGTYGNVVKARCKQTGTKVAIKLIDNIFSGNNLLPKYVLREMQLLDQLTTMPGNIFTTSLKDIVLPASNNKDLKTFDHIFLVMEYSRMDLGKLLSKNNDLCEFSEDHVLCIVYNILCSLNFLDSANVLHRDLKPNNILIDANCVVKICDFGFARTLP